MKKIKLTRVTAVIIGVLISIPLLVGGLLTYFGVFSRASFSAPVDVVVSKLTEGSATISWTTDEDAQSTVQYGTDPADMGLFFVETSATMSHTVNLTLLEESTTYYFVIVVNDEVYDNGGVPWNFTTKSSESAGDGEATPSASLSTTPTATPSGTLTPTEGEEEPTPTGEEEPTPEDSEPSPTRRPSTTRAPTIQASTPTRISCSTTNCSTILANLGPGKCSASDYQRCIARQLTAAPTATQSATPSPTTTPRLETPSNLQTWVNSSSQITVTWADKSDNEDGFEVERALFSSNPSYGLVATVSAGIQQYVNSGLTSGSTYIYRVRAFRFGGFYSGYSNVSQSTTQ